MIFRSTVHHRNRWSVVRHLEASYDGGVVQRPRGVVRRRCRTTPGGVVTTVVSYDTSRRRTTPPSSSHRTLGNQRPINVDRILSTSTCLVVTSSLASSFALPVPWHAASCTLAKKPTQTGILKLPCLMRSPRKATPTINKLNILMNLFITQHSYEFIHES